MYVQYDGVNYIVMPGFNKNAIAWATYSDRILEDGTAYLWLHTEKKGKHPDDVVAYAAGVLEGYLSADRISSHYINLKGDMMADFNGEWDPAFVDYSEKQIAWMQEQIESNPEDPWWIQVNLILTQLQGILEGVLRTGYMNEATFMDLYLMNMAGDWDDLSLSLHPEEVTSQKIAEHWDSHSHCTASVRYSVVDDNHDIFFSQDTWSSYVGMTRIMKSYDLDFTVSKSIHSVFSSYPAFLFSLDDMYVLDTGLAVYETTMHTWNTELYELYVHPGSVPTWIRTVLSNRLSTTGPDWMNNFSRINSGTYNNQWVVVDYKLFEKSGVNELLPHTSTTMEICPGNYVIWDSTEELMSTGYLIGQNKPVNATLADISGTTQKGNEDSYWAYDGPRLWIFQDQMPNVFTYEQFREFTRYNNYEKDELTRHDPGQTICSRYDLRKDIPGHDATPFGGLDSKTTNSDLVKKMSFDIIPSPTTQPDLPPWRFSSWELAPVGLPDEMTFDWVHFDGFRN